MKQLSVTVGEELVTIWELGAGSTGLLLVPAIFGVDPGTLQVAEALAQAGARVWVYDPFFRSDPGVCGFDEDGFARAIARMKLTDVKQAEQDQAALLKAMGTPRTLVLGICFGGKFAVLHAAAGRTQGGASFHGGGIGGLLDQAPACADVPLTLHFGDQDQSIRVDEVERISAAFGAERVHLHAGVGHGFGHPGSPNYSAEVSAKAMKAVVALINED